MATTVMNDLRYSLDDFSPVGMIARVSYGLAVHPRLPVNTMAELIHHARRHAGLLNYASSGVASTSNVFFELLKGISAVDLVHIPFKGSAIGINELVAGRVDVVFADLSALVPLADRGLLRLIAVAGAARSPKLPTVPTVGEQGFPELAIEPWYGLMAPRDTASSIIAILNDALIATLRSDEIREQFDHLGYSRIEATPEQMQNLMQTELRSFATFIDPSRLRPER